MQLLKCKRLCYFNNLAKDQAFTYNYSNSVHLRSSANIQISEKKFNPFKTETKLKKFQTIVISKNSVLKEFVTVPEKNLADFDQYDHIQSLHKQNLSKYVSSLFDRHSFFNEIQQRFTLIPRMDLRKLAYEVLELEKNLQPMRQYYKLRSEDEFKELLISQNDFVVLENLRVYFSIMKEPILKQFINLATSLCEANQSIYILNNITQNLSCILQFCDNIPQNDIEQFLKKIEEQLESNLLFDSKEVKDQFDTLNVLINLLGKLQELIYNYTNIEQFQFPVLIKIAQKVVNSQIVLKENQKYDFQYNINLISLMLLLDSNDVPQSFRVRLLNRYKIKRLKKFLSFQNYVANIDQDFIIKTLGTMLLKNHHITQEFADSMMKSTKFLKLQIMDIYIIIQSFLAPGLDIVQHLDQLYMRCKIIFFQNYISFWHTIATAKSLADLKTVLMAAKIQEYFQQSIISSNALVFDKKTAKLAQIIQDTLLKVNLVGKMSDILEISNVFNKILLQPTFLFQIVNQYNLKNIQIKHYSQEVQVNQTTAEKLKTLVEIQTQRQKRQYFYLFQKKWQQFQQDNLEFESQNQPIISLIGQAIRQSEFISDPLIESYIILLAQKKFFNNDDNIEHKLIKDYLYIWLQYQELQEDKVGFIAVVMQFIKNNNTDSEIRQSVLAKYFDFYIKYQKKFQLTQLLSFYYETIQTILSFSQSEVNALKDIYYQTMKQDFKKFVIPLINKNSKYTVSKIQGDKYTQKYLQSQMIDDLNNFEYVLPIMDRLKVSLSGQIVMDQITNLTKRVCKTWTGLILVENLILLDKYNIAVFTIYLYCVENLTTCFYFDPQNRAFISMLTFDQTLALLRVYIKQFKWLSGSQIDQLKYYRNSLRILTYFADVVYNKLTFDEVITIFEIVGENDVNYWPPFLEKFQKMDLKLNVNFLQQMANVPYWIQNNSFLQKVNICLSLQKSTNITPQLVKVLQNLSIYNIDVEEHLIKEFVSKKSNLQCLEYIRSCSNLEKESIKSLFQIWENQINKKSTIQDKLNYAIIFVVYSLKNQIKIIPNSVEGQAINSFKVEINNQTQGQDITKLTNSLRELVMHKQQKTFIIGSEILNQYDLKYYETMNNMESHLYTPNWKVFPCFWQGDAQPINQFYQFIVNQTQQEQDKFITESMHYVQQLYSFWTQENFTSHDVVEANETLQNIRQIRSRQDENQISLLISLTLSIPNHQVKGYKFNYRNAYHCPKTHMTLDLAIFKQNETEQHQIGLIFTSQSDIVQIYQENEQINKIFLSPMSQLKAYILNQIGEWEVYFIIRDDWTKIYDTRKKQEQFIHKIIGI